MPFTANPNLPFCRKSLIVCGDTPIFEAASSTFKFNFTLLSQKKTLYLNVLKPEPVEFKENRKLRQRRFADSFFPSPQGGFFVTCFFGYFLYGQSPVNSHGLDSHLHLSSLLSVY